MAYRASQLGFAAVLAAVYGSWAAAPAPQATPAPSATPRELLDYATISHKLVVERIRAGSHDPSGSNQYVFQVAMVGLLNTPEQRNLPFDKRRRLDVDLGSFGACKLDALSIWKPDEKSGDIKELAIDGDQIRELTARVMSEFQVEESEVSILVEISLYEQEKKFLFFGHDKLLTKSSFYPIPPTAFDTPLRTNTIIMMQDSRGLEVKIAVRFDKAIEKKRGDTASSTSTASQPSTSAEQSR